MSDADCRLNIPWARGKCPHSIRAKTLVVLTLGIFRRQNLHPARPKARSNGGISRNSENRVHECRVCCRKVPGERQSLREYESQPQPSRNDLLPCASCWILRRSRSTSYFEHQCAFFEWPSGCHPMKCLLPLLEPLDPPESYQWLTQP